ncbi:FAD-dependent monooxygenase [Roseomonas haemaphysalidis]|uniref:FAD-dependent monooxygenase n=1 Tax=Roseomonas haemaphysalidis TaxID=2768162 RepID=A0ABS3KTB0_9PROT|nr:FAD-dependent monooxygenase [Roseomonas haemaphysalidis]MBO1080710.1 FAD-dependent monooxygenase [Roseomonas haemaphysalidis]
MASTNSDRPARIMVAGGGIGGMTAALALIRAGFSVTLLEQAPVLGDVGAGLTVQPSATRAIDYLGLGAAFRRFADPSPSSWVFHHRTGEAIAELMSAGHAADADGVTWYHRVHRADFLAMLESAIRAASPDTLRLGCRVARVEQGGGRVVAVLADGTRVEGDALVGADGARSPIRAQLFDTGTPQFRGQVAYRCLIPMERVRDALGGRTSGTYIGPGRIFNQYPVRRGTILNCVGIVRTGDWQEEGWSTPATHEEFRAQFAGWHESLTGVIAEAPGDQLIKWALYDRDPLPRWSDGRITLLGDAAHPILPFLGLAGAMAIEDAVVLARACAASPDDLEAAFLNYERVRQPRTRHVLINSREQGEVYQDSDTDAYATRPRPNADPELYTYNPATAAL